MSHKILWESGQHSCTLSTPHCSITRLPGQHLLTSVSWPHTAAHVHVENAGVQVCLGGSSWGGEGGILWEGGFERSSSVDGWLSLAAWKGRSGIWENREWFLTVLHFWLLGDDFECLVTVGSTEEFVQHPCSDAELNLLPCIQSHSWKLMDHPKLLLSKLKAQPFFGDPLPSSSHRLNWAYGRAVWLSPLLHKSFRSFGNVNIGSFCCCFLFRLFFCRVCPGSRGLGINYDPGKKKKKRAHTEKEKKKNTFYIYAKTVYLCPINTKMCEYADVLRNIFIY